MLSFTRKFFIPIIIFSSVIILFLSSCKENSAQDTPSANNYMLKSYENTVALYNGDEIITIYNNIVLNTLPPEDIYTFNIGVPVATPAQAELYLEDFDG